MERTTVLLRNEDELKEVIRTFKMLSDGIIVLVMVKSFLKCLHIIENSNASPAWAGINYLSSSLNSFFMDIPSYEKSFTLILLTN